MIVPTIGAEEIRAVIHGAVGACLFVGNSVVNLFFAGNVRGHRKTILQDWKRNPWRAGAEVFSAVGAMALLGYAIAQG